ncbi:hypothetical protein CLOHYLEM_03983 [[Clostridium] hylemonae DSM 15053]|uniref:Uncharacterized protein n=1 Tax=[Clostridium] hylemonae DSM 15053 TaxID=553973 RepID=C0BW79_9FIRM|nr:hypothetical protein CLOHYLEM_03983 [[Clostridium] hylemonae DSM 15053]
MRKTALYPEVITICLRETYPQGAEIQAPGGIQTQGGTQIPEEIPEEALWAETRGAIQAEIRQAE